MLFDVTFLLLIFFFPFIFVANKNYCLIHFAFYLKKREYEWVKEKKNTNIEIKKLIELNVKRKKETFSTNNTK